MHTSAFGFVRHALPLLLASVLAAPAVAQSGAAAPPAAPTAAPTKVPVAGLPTSVEDWSDRLWQSARTGDRSSVDMLLENVPDGQATDAVSRLRALIARRDMQATEAKKAAAEMRLTKLAEMAEAQKADKVAKALVSAAYIKYLDSDWKTELKSDAIQQMINWADQKADAARKAGDWVLAEDLYSRLRTLYEGTPFKDQYQKYDDILETDVSPRVTLILEYAPRVWHGLRKAQYERLDPKDRTRPFPEFNQKAADDWKSQLNGLNEAMLGEALSQIASQHLENVGWQPLIMGGLNMVQLLGTTPSLKENFQGVGDSSATLAFSAAVKAQMDAVSKMRAPEVDSRTLGRVMAALRKANDQTIKLPFEAIIREFGNGAIATVTHEFEDPYTEIVWPDRMRRFNQAIKGNFVGVGVLIRHNDNREIIIENPLDGSPARRAGIKPKDKIVAVDGVSTADWPLDRAVDTITGPAGTTVKLTVAREGEAAPLEVPLVRQKIKMYSVQGWKKTGYNERSEPVWDWYIDQDAGIGYVRLTSFTDDTFTDFLRAVKDMATQRDLNGLVLDLRGNPGGLMQSAIQLVNAFVPNGRILSVEDRLGQELFAYNANPARAPLQNLPTVVLINEGSASASEIVSGALEAHDAAVVLGERSFGKGSVQEVHGIGGRGADADASVKFTVQHYLLPPKTGEAKGRLVHKKPGAEDWGVVPDYLVRITPVQLEEINKIRASADDLPQDPNDEGTADDSTTAEKPDAKTPKVKRDPAELIEKGVDPQLQAALILLQGRVLKDEERQAAAQKGAAKTPTAANTPATKPGT